MSKVKPFTFMQASKRMKRMNSMGWYYIDHVVALDFASAGPFMYLPYRLLRFEEDDQLSDVIVSSSYVLQLSNFAKIGPWYSFDIILSPVAQSIECWTPCGGENTRPGYKRPGFETRWALDIYEPPGGYGCGWWRTETRRNQWGRIDYVLTHHMSRSPEVIRGHLRSLTSDDPKCLNLSLGSTIGCFRVF